MVQIAALTADLSANSAAFAADMGKASRALKSNTVRMNRQLGRLDRAFGSIKRSVGGMVKGLFSFRAAMGAVAAAAVLAVLIKKSLDMADSIAKTADSIGISTEALQEWRFIAGLSGVETAQFDKSLKFLVKTIGELKTRTDSELVTALKNYNPVLLETLRNVNSFEEGLNLSIKALSEETDATKKAALAKSLFGRTGQDNINIVRGGTAAVEAMAQRFRDLGLVIKDELLRNAEDAKDRLSDLGDVLKVTVTTAVLEHAEAIEELAIQLTAAIPKIKAWVISFGEWIGLLEQTPVRRLAEIDAAIAELREELERPIAFQALGGALFDIEVPTVARLNELLREQRRIRAGIRDDIRVAARASLAPPTEVAPGDDEGGGDAAELARLRTIEARREEQAILALGAGYEDLFIRQVRVAKESRELAEDLAEQGRIIRVAVMTPLEVYNKELAELNRLFKAGAIDLETFNRAVAQAQEPLKAMGEGAEDVADSFHDLGREVQSTMRRLTDDLLTGELSWESFARTAINAIRSVIEAQFSASISTSSGGGFGGFIGDILGSIVGDFDFFGGGINPDPGNITLLGKQHGGPIAAGVPVVVGEAGPEIIVPRRGSTVLPNDVLGAMGTNVTIHQSLDFRGAQPGVFADAQRFKDEIKEETVAAVFDLINQGGKEAQTVGRRRARP